MQCDKAVELKDAFLAMMSLLEAEHQAIRTRETDVLAEVTQQKAQLAKRLEILGQTLIRELRLSADMSDNNKLLALVGAHCQQQHPQLAKTLKESAEKVQELNNRNGILLQSVMRINEQSLNILTGRSERVATYQSSGQLKSEQSSSSTPLASA
jgi:flagellar biosynthesis/type III secretory pathway chaperone